MEMKNIIKKIISEDGILLSDKCSNKCYKKIRVVFNNADKFEVIRTQLINIEIEKHLNNEFNDNFTLDRKDEYIPVELSKKKTEYDNDNNEKIFYFEEGETEFNDGAMFLIEIKLHDIDKNYVYVFKLSDGKWIHQEDCNEIKCSKTCKYYYLSDAKWIEK